MNFPECDLIIARYNEDISWIKGRYDNVFIYNKNEDEINTKFISKKLKNIGREAHTYLYHIVENYENLNKINIFSQGNISDHGLSENLFHDFYMETLKYGASLNREFCPEWMHVFGGYTGFRLNAHNGQNLFRSKYNLYEWKKKHQISFDPKPFRWYQKAIFAVSREHIYSRNLNFYKKLLEDPELNHTSPEVAHYYERSWAVIFNLF